MHFRYNVGGDSFVGIWLIRKVDAKGWCQIADGLNVQTFQGLE